MTFFQLALQAEAAGQLASALAAYERSIDTGEGHLDAFTNLAFLYWHIGYDHGVQTLFLQANALPDTAVADFDARWRWVLVRAIEQFPDEPEPHYWRSYFTWESAYVDRPEAYLLAMPDRWPAFDLPYLYRYQHECQGEAERAALGRLHACYRPEFHRKGAFIANAIETIWRFAI